MLKIYDISIDNVIAPSLTKTKDLRFGWRLDSDKSCVMQTSYRVKIHKDNAVIFDSSIVDSAKNFDITFDGLILPSRSELTLCVEVCDSYGERAVASIGFATEILPDEWGNAKWIKPKEHIIGWAPYLRTKFSVGKIQRAVMYACGLGVAQYYVNGKIADDSYIDPPFTNYEKTVFYRRYDLTDMLIEGNNALCVLLGEGFYSQSRVWGFNGFYYGDVCARIRLEITLCDGSQRVIETNTKDWKYKYSPITVNSIYGGETYDCRLETPDFCDPDGSDNGWGEVIIDKTPKGELTPCLIPPVKAIRTLPAKKVVPCSGTNDGAWIYDIGENISGIAEFRLPRSPRGAVYVFRYTESLNGNYPDHRSIGAFATQCIQQDIYICRGDKRGEVYRPRFCYHGYRYIEVTGVHDFSKGYGTMPKLSLCRGIQLSTDFERTGDFTCSYKPLKSLYKIMDNTFRSNFHGFPEDCPAREKCGWLGDAQITCNFGLQNYSSVSSYEKYLDDIRSTRDVYGVWQMTSPGKRGCGEASPLWGCAQVLIPYFLYKYHGDCGAVINNFDLMEAWVRHELERAEDYIISVGLGDWCPPEGNDNPRRMPVPHSSTFMFYEICQTMAELCQKLNIGDAEYYSALACKIKESIIRNFYNHDTHTYGYWGSDAVALTLGIYPDGERIALLSAFVETIKKDRYAMPTAIYSNKYLFPLLLEEGYGDIALKVLFNKRHESFDTMLRGGATTLWETFDVLSKDIKTKHIPSMNHPMHGGFLYACQEYIAGIRPTSPGFAEFEINPCYTKGVDNFDAYLTCPSGKISVKGNLLDGVWSYIVEVPANTRCTLNFKKTSTMQINGEAARVGTIIGSGKYRIDINVE